MYPQSGEEIPQDVEIDRFGDARIAARILNAFRVLEGSIPCNRYNRHVRKMFLPAHPMNQREAVFAAEMNVQEYRLRQGFRGNEHESRFERVSEYGFKAFSFQPAAQKFAKHRIIFDNENAMFHLPPTAGGTVVQNHNALDASNHELYQRGGRRASRSRGRGNQGPDRNRKARWKVLNATTLSPRQNLSKRFPGLPYTNETPRLITRFVIRSANPRPYSKQSPHPLTSLVQLRLRISNGAFQSCSDLVVFVPQHIV